MRKNILVAFTTTILIISLFSTMVFADWYNSTSFPLSRQIINNATTQLVVSVNDTGLVKGKVLWALIANESRLTSSLSDSNGLISVANSTNQKYFEWENNLSGNLPTSLWTNNFLVYHFGESSGTESADSTWNSNLSISGGTLGNTTGIFGNSFFSDGDTCGQTNVTIPLNTTHEMTITYWIKIFDTSPVYHGFIENVNNANGFYMALPCDVSNNCQGEFLFKSTNGNLWVSTGLPSTNQLNTWYFVACAYDRNQATSATQLRCFVNNTKYTTSGTMSQNTDGFESSSIFVGGRGCSSLLSTFQMDEFRLYKTALTDDEILDIYYNGRNNLTRLGSEETAVPVYPQWKIPTEVAPLVWDSESENCIFNMNWTDSKGLELIDGFAGVHFETDISGSLNNGSTTDNSLFPPNVFSYTQLPPCVKNVWIQWRSWAENIDNNFNSTPYYYSYVYTNDTVFTTTEAPPYISVTFNFNTGNFTNLTSPSANNSAPNQLSGVYNVSVDTNANYKVQANGTNFSGAGTIPIGNLRIDTNSSAGSLAVGSSTALTTSPQDIDNYTNTATMNFFGFWLSIGSSQPTGAYYTTVKITYSNI